MSYEVLNIGKSLRMRRVTWRITGGGGKMDHILQILDLKSAQFMYSFRHDTPKIKRYRRKIVFIPLCRLTTKLTVHA